VSLLILTNSSAWSAFNFLLKTIWGEIFTNNILIRSVPITTKLWVWILLVPRFTRYNIMGSNLSVTCGRSVVFSRYSVFLHQ
jgi:hypothetical protein